MRIRYNAPVTLTFTLIATIVLMLDTLLGLGLIPGLFSIPGRNHFSFTYAPNYLRLFTHAAGHWGWQHLLGNFAFILLLGPILEEKYGSFRIATMILLTALFTGLLNVFLMPDSLLAGASGIVFMMILLISFTQVKAGEIPLTFILVALLYVSREIIGAFQEDNISQLAHIAGGACGAMFGFIKPSKH